MPLIDRGLQRRHSSSSASTDHVLVCMCREAQRRQAVFTHLDPLETHADHRDGTVLTVTVLCAARATSTGRCKGEVGSPSLKVRASMHMFPASLHPIPRRSSHSRAMRA